MFDEFMEDCDCILAKNTWPKPPFPKNLKLKQKLAFYSNYTFLVKIMQLVLLEFLSGCDFFSDTSLHTGDW